MSSLEERDFSDVSSIPEYFKWKSIFITGGTGYLGKLIIEKLLYSCPDLDRIYLFVRSKKGISPEERLAALYNNSCFDRLRNERNGLFQSKVLVIPGNIVEEDLGMSEKDRALVINTTNVIIHSAASVRFDDTLNESGNINFMGTLRMIDLAKEICNLECFVHVSTAFCNKHRDIIEEKLYPPVADWREILEICKNMDPYTLEVLTPKLLGEFPNTYVFMKHLVEYMINEQRGKLPLIIVRPSIVSGCISEPIIGWIDNFNGPVGLIVAGGQGILRTVYADKLAGSDYIPADVAVKGILIATWVRGTTKLQETDDVSIYNACSGEQHSMSLDEILNIGLEASPIIAFEYTFRSTHISYHSSNFIYNIYVYLFHLLPAIVIDGLLHILGKRPMLLRIQRRLYIANTALQYFMTRSWLFSNDNFMKLRSILKPQDHNQFSYSLEGIKTIEYLASCGLHARKYLLHQKDETLPKWRTYYKRVVLFDAVVTYIFYGYLLWWILRQLSSTFIVTLIN